MNKPLNGQKQEDLIQRKGSLQAYLIILDYARDYKSSKAMTSMYAVYVCGYVHKEGKHFIHDGQGKTSPDIHSQSMMHQAQTNYSVSEKFSIWHVSRSSIRLSSGDEELSVSAKASLLQSFTLILGLAISSGKSQGFWAFPC